MTVIPIPLSEFPKAREYEDEEKVEENDGYCKKNKTLQYNILYCKKCHCIRFTLPDCREN
jgi:hypothetical protein